MPVAAAAITAAATLAATKMSSNASGKASRSQAKATDDALQFEREREATRRAEYDRAQKMQQAAWEAREANRLAILRRYGVNTSPATPGASPGATTGVPAGVGPRLSSLIGNTDPRIRLVPPAMEAAPQRTGTFADLSSNWHKWGGR